MATPVKLLVCGDVNGRFHDVFNRVASVHKSAAGPFDVLFCVGKFFGSSATENAQIMEIISGKQNVAVPTYFIDPRGGEDFISDPSERKELCHNLTYLGTGGVCDIQKLRIAYFSQDATTKSGTATFRLPQETREFLDRNREEFLSAPLDVLLTTMWPRGVLRYIEETEWPQGEGVNATTGTTSCAAIAAEVAPRYHFSATHRTYFQRKPYRNHRASHASVFIGLGAVAKGKSKPKYLYAVSIIPAASMDAASLAILPKDVTDCPYALTTATEETPVPQTPQGAGVVPGVPVPTGGSLLPSPSAGSSNADQAPHPVVPVIPPLPQMRVGAQVSAMSVPLGFGRGAGFASLHDAEEGNQMPNRKRPRTDFGPRGGMSVRGAGRGAGRGGRGGGQQRRGPKEDDPRSKECWFCLSSPLVETHLIVHVGTHAYAALAKGGLVPNHVIVMPIQHINSTSSFPKEVEDEIQLYLSSLRRMFDTNSEDMVVLDRNVNVRGHDHAHVQVIPVPKGLQSAVEECLTKLSAQHRMTFKEKPEGLSIPEYVEGSEFFALRLPDGKVMVQKVGEERHPLQFGREVIAHALGMPDKTSWKVCQLPKTAEELLADSFRTRFKPFAPAS